MSQQIADWLVHNGNTNQKDLQELIPAQGGTDCLLPAYGKWIGLLWSGSAMTTEKTDRGKTIRAHQPPSLTPLFTPIPKR